MSILTILKKFANYLDSKGDFELADMLDRKIAMFVSAESDNQEIRKLIQTIAGNLHSRALTEVLELSQEGEHLLSSLNSLVAQSVSEPISNLIQSVSFLSSSLDSFIKKQNGQTANSIDPYVEEKLINLNQDVLEVLLKAEYLYGINKTAADGNQMHPQMAPFPNYKPLAVNQAPKMTETEHNVLNVAGLAPLLGEGFDLVNALAYAEEGKYIYSALSIISMIPVVGDAFGKGSVLLLKIVELLGQKMAPKVIMAAFSQAQQLQLQGIKYVYEQNVDTINKVFKELEKVPVFGKTATKIQSALTELMNIL